MELPARFLQFAKLRLNLVGIFIVVLWLTIGFAVLTALCLVGEQVGKAVIASTFMTEFAAGMMCIILAKYITTLYKNHLLNAALYYGAIQIPGMYIVRIFGINIKNILPDSLFHQIGLAALIWTLCIAAFYDRMRAAKMQPIIPL